MKEARPLPRLLPAGQSGHVDGRLFAFELGLPRLELLSQLDQIEVRLPCLRKDRRLLFLHMVLDIFGKHLDARFKMFVPGAAARDLLDELLDVAVLDIGFVERVVGVAGLAQRRIEYFLFDLGVNPQRVADCLRDLLHPVGVLTLLQFFELPEKLLCFRMVCLQQIERSLRARRAGCGSRSWHRRLRDLRWAKAFGARGADHKTGAFRL